MSTPLPTAPKPEYGLAHHVYGKQAALYFSVDTTRGGQPTLMLEAALANAPQSYNWAEKIRIQLTPDELLNVVSVLLNLLPHCEYSAHGPEHDKGFSLTHQGNTIFCRVSAKNQKVRTVPIPLEEAFRVAALGIRQIQQSNPWLDTMGLLTLLQRTVGQKQPKSTQNST